MKTDYFLPYQKRWIMDDSPLKFCSKSRRVGFTYATSYRANDKCLRRRGFTQWVTSRDELTAREFITDYIAKWAQASNIICKGINGENCEVIDAEKGIRAFTATYENGNRILSLSSTPEAFAGKGGDIIIDEADLHKDSGKVIDMAMPCTTWGYQLEMLSALSVDGGPNTPFCRMERDILENGNPMGWSHHRVSIIDAVNDGFVEKLNEVTGSSWTREAWLAMMRAKCRSEEAWQTQYLITPSNDGAALLPYELIASCEVPRETLLNGTDEKYPRYAGYDVGRKKDLAVYFELELRGDVLWQTGYDVLAKTSFPLQTDFLKNKLKNPQLKRLCIDYTGMGGPVCEELQRSFGTYRVEGVTFSNPVKEALAMALKATFEDKLLRLASDPEVREDLHKIRKTVTEAGNIRFEAERDENGHSDRFWSLALARQAKGQNDGACLFEAAGAPDNSRSSGYGGSWSESRYPDHSDDK